MKNYQGGGGNSSSHKKGVQSVGGPSQLKAMTVGQGSALGGGSTSSILRHSSITPDRHNSNQQVFVGQPNNQVAVPQQPQIKLTNQKFTDPGSSSAIPQKQKQTSSSQPRGNLIKKAKISQQASGAATAGLRGSSQQLPSNIESIQQLGTNINNSVAVMMNQRVQQPSPAAQQSNLLNQNTSIDEIIAQQQNFAKNYNNSTALIGSSRKAQKIQIHMKNNRFHNRKASGPAALSAATAASTNLQNKQFLLQKQGAGQGVQQSNVSQERISNYDSSIQQQNSAQFFDSQSYGGQMASAQPGAPNQAINPASMIMHQTRTSSRQGGRLTSGQGSNSQNVTVQSNHSTNQNRPPSKGMKRKDKSNGALANQQFGRTFFHPPSGSTGLDQQAHPQSQGNGAQGPSMIDHNQVIGTSQFNTTTAGSHQIPTQMKMANGNQIIGNHVRAGTQIDMHKDGAMKAKNFINRKDGSQDRSQIHFQKPSTIMGGVQNSQFDLPSGKHAKSKSQNKFSQPELSRYQNSIERIGAPHGANNESSLTMQSTVTGISNKEKRQNFSLNQQQQAQLKQSLQKTQNQKQVDIMLNSAYNLKTTNRKQQMKGTQQIQKKMLSGVSFPSSLNQTQSVRFPPGSSKGAPNAQQNSGVPNIANYNTTGPLTQSTNQSGMNSTTQPNAHLIFPEGNQTSQSPFVNTATIPMIKNGEPQQIDQQMKSAYANTQILDRLFNQTSSNSNGSNKKRTNKGSSAVALAKSGQGPNTDFMPSSATSATAFYAASKQAQQQQQQLGGGAQDSNSQMMFTNYNNQLQSVHSGGKQKSLHPSGFASGQISGGNTTLQGSTALHQILAQQAQSLASSNDGVSAAANPTASNADKGNKNSFYLKQQLQSHNRGKNGSKDRSQFKMKNTPSMPGEEAHGLSQQQQQQHRKNHSVVINRAEMLRVGDGTGKRQLEMSPDRMGQSNKALKLPGMHSDQQSQHMYKNSIMGVGHSSQGLSNNNYASQFGDQVPSDYMKSVNQSATNANTRALKTKGSARSLERQNKQNGAMTPSIERTSVTNQKVGMKGSQSINHHQERQNYVAAGQQNGSEQYPGSSGINYPQVLNNTKQVMVTDGGTGASLKRVFIQQESTHTSQADSQSNYGSTVQHHTQNYHLPIKAGGSSNHGALNNKQTKRIQMQKVNANKFANINNASNSSGVPPLNNYQSGAFSNTRQESNSDKQSIKSGSGPPAKAASNAKTKASSSVARALGTGQESQTISQSYKTNLEQRQMQQVTRAQQKLRTESRKDNRAISMGQPQDYLANSLEMTDPENSMDDRGQQKRSISINITEEALRRGKLPCEDVARNISLNKYNAKGHLKGASQGGVSPRVIEMVGISNRIKQAFDETGEAPETTTDFYRAGKMLGRGAFGKVNLGMHKLTRKLVAIKSINQEYLSDDKQRSKIMHEVGILLRLRHQSVVKLYETFETKRHIMLVMELCAGGDLLNFVRKRKKCDEPLAKVLFKQIIEGIGYIHSKSILHRDIKLDNILLDGKGLVKIADFGVSKTVKPGEVMYEQSGTPAYIAPEIIRNEGYKGFKADLWSAGVVLFALLFGTVPFKANNMKDLHQQILQAKYNMKDEVSDEAKNLIRGLLNTNPKKRLSVRKVLMHPWLAGTEFLSTDIFNEAEKEVIRSEFTYNDPSRFNRNERVNMEEEPWDCFTELNLDSMNQTLRNASEKSLILAPFNSTMSDVDAFFRSILSMAEMEDKKEVLKFAARCRDQDRQYEINNNAELDNGVYHKFVYSTKDSKAADDDKAKGKGREQEGEGALLSRNSSRQQIDGAAGANAGATNEDSEDLTKARDNRAGMQKEDLKAEREALKADIRRMKEPGGAKAAAGNKAEDSEEDQDSEDQLANTNQSHFTVALEEDRVQTLANFGYPIDYVKYTILENEANYCCTAYYLLGTDQNY